MAAHEPLTDPLIDDSFYAGDAFPQYARLRDEAPVVWNDTKGFWAVSRWDGVMAVSTDPETFCSGRGILVMEIGASYDSPPTMMHTDPPEHTVYRKLAQPGFAPGYYSVLFEDPDGIRVEVNHVPGKGHLGPGGRLGPGGPGPAETYGADGLAGRPRDRG